MATAADARRPFTFGDLRAGSCESTEGARHLGRLRGRPGQRRNCISAAAVAVRSAVHRIVGGGEDRVVAEAVRSSPAPGLWRSRRRSRWCARRRAIRAGGEALGALLGDRGVQRGHELRADRDALVTGGERGRVAVGVEGDLRRSASGAAARRSRAASRPASCRQVSRQVPPLRRRPRADTADQYRRRPAEARRGWAGPRCGGGARRSLDR